jgi:hypothetical protein
MRLGSLTVIVLIGLVLIGDLFFIYGLARDLLYGPGGL